ncbi:MAG: hypothetical protein KGL57_00805 [Burkholderiales bacterium]|nr:hypothetical protein [Burkholderiales bacterium]
MKNFNYLHLSGFSAVGLLVACLAQQWFGDHRPYSASQAAYRTSAEAIQAAQTERREVSARQTLLREDRQEQESQRAKQMMERKNRDQAWQAFYVQPSACQNPSTNRLFTACADEHIRARREFDQAYAANLGVLKPFHSTVATNEE